MSEYSQYARAPKDAFGSANHDKVANTLLTNTILHSYPPQWGIVRWLGPIAAKDELAMYYGFEKTERSLKLNYIPDAYFELYVYSPEQKKAGIYPVVLEVDMGTESTNRVIKKLEAGVRLFSAKPGGRQYNIVWYFVCKESRFSSATNAMKARLEQLRTELPSGSLPQVLVTWAPEDDYKDQHYPNHTAMMGLLSEQNGTFTGRQSEILNTVNEFLGVSIGRDLKQNKVLRTQILSLKHENGGN